MGGVLNQNDDESDVRDENYDPGEENLTEEPGTDRLFGSSHIWVSSALTIQVGDVLDILDSTGHWCEAEVVKINHQEQAIYVTYLYWNNKFDEWIHDIEQRTAPLHEHTYHEGGELKVGQRVEALDEKGHWMHAYVVDADSNQVKVHYHSFHPRFDRWISRSENSIRPYGRANAVALNKFPKNKLWRVPRSVPVEEHKDHSPSKSAKLDDGRSMQHTVVDEHRERRIQPLTDRYSHYTRALSSENLRIYPVLGDGNCLFRSVAHQIYGNNDYHWIVRQKCMDYMEADAEFFSQFIEGGRESFPLYLRAKRLNACWGDDPEIQAISEIYNRPAEIWAYDSVLGARKLRTFHEVGSGRMRGHLTSATIRLSYYGGGHYDSIVDSAFDSHLVRNQPGEVEDFALLAVKQRLLLRESLTLGSSSTSPENIDSDRLAFNESVEMNRKDLDWTQDDLDSCLAVSLINEAKKLGYDKTLLHEATKGAPADDIMATQREILSQVTKCSEDEFLEQAIIKSLDTTETVEDELLARAEIESAFSVFSATAADRPPAEDKDFKAALKLSQLSADEALELAIQESMKSSAEPPPSSLSEDEALQLALKKSMVDDVAYSRVMSGATAGDVEDEFMSAALAASLASAASHLSPLAYESEDDEDLKRAIAASMQQR